MQTFSTSDRRDGEAAPEIVQEGQLLGRVRAGDGPTVTLAVPVYDGEATIERCLESLLAQEVDFAYEVIVVDSSDDRTPEIICERFPAVRLLRFGSRTQPGPARNAAVRAAGARLVAMVDADCVAAPDLLARMVALHGSGDYVAVGGAVCNGTPKSATGTIGYLLEFREFMPSAPRREVATAPTANICYRREIFDCVGYFDAGLAAEDIRFNWRLTAAGHKILFDPSARVTHLNRTGLRTVLRHQVRLGEGSALTRLVTPPPEAARGYEAEARLRPLLVSHPWLGAILPFMRLRRALAWLLRYDVRAFARLLVFAPLYLLTVSVWSASFVRTLMRGTGDSQDQTYGRRPS